MHLLSSRAAAWTAGVCTAVLCASTSLAGTLDTDALNRNNTQIIVKFSDQRAADSVLARFAAAHGIAIESVRTMASGAQVLRADKSVSEKERDALIAQLARDPAVEYAELDRILVPQATPNDTRYNEQWHYFESTGGINGPAAWDTTTGAGVVVAVIDTGYRPHADLSGKIVGGYDFIGDLSVANDGNGRDSDASDPGDWVTAGECYSGSPASNSSWHGTHVAGTIGAKTNNGTGVAGVAWDAQILPVRVLGQCGGYTSDIADGITWAAGGSVSGVPANSNPAQVLNLSLGGSGSCASATQSAINSARALGATVVVAAGNSNANASNYTPASCAGVISVASVDRGGARAYYSNYGSVVDLAAPGGETNAGSANGVLSTLNSGTTTPGSDSYAFYQGTSMATPHMAGVAALLYAVDASITPDAVEATLIATARAFPGSCSQCGAGIVDAAAAVAAAGGGGGGGGPTALDNGVAVTGLSGATGNETFYTLEVPAGQSALSFVMSGGSGDADLYVRYGTAPTTSTYDCRPYVGGNNETCDFTNPQAGTWHVMLRGYSAYSGAQLIGSYSGGGGGGGACAAGYTEYDGTLTGTGDDEFEPDGTYYYTGSSGIHAGALSGAGSDFDLYLRKWNGSGWANVASSTSANSEETISYNGSSGYYTWRVYSYNGSGAYSLCLNTP